MVILYFWSDVCVMAVMCPLVVIGKLDCWALMVERVVFMEEVRQYCCWLLLMGNKIEKNEGVSIVETKI